MQTAESAGREFLWDQSINSWRVQGHSAARIVLTDVHISTVREPVRPLSLDEDNTPSAVEFLTSWFSRSPSERHRSIKSQLSKPYAEPSIWEFEPAMSAIADECEAALANEFDLVSDFLEPFWLRSIASILAVPKNEHQRLAKAVKALTAVLSRPQLDERAAEVVNRCARYLRELVDQLFALESAPPVIMALRQIRHDPESGGIWSAVGILAQLLTAGFQPTLTCSVLTWQALLDNQTLHRDVSRGADSLDEFIDEALRLHPPFPFVHRWVMERCECQGVALDPGAHLIVDLRAANRDPAVFENPNEFVADRNRALGLSFGYGPHRCLGPALARLQIKVAVEKLLSTRPPVRPIAMNRGILAGSNHLLVIKSLPCRRDNEID